MKSSEENGAPIWYLHGTRPAHSRALYPSRWLRFAAIGALLNVSAYASPSLPQDVSVQRTALTQLAPASSPQVARVRALQLEWIHAQKARKALEDRHLDASAALHHEDLLRVTYETALAALPRAQRDAINRELPHRQTQSRLGTGALGTATRSQPSEATLRPPSQNDVYIALLVVTLAGASALILLAFRRRKRSAPRAQSLPQAEEQIAPQQHPSVQAPVEAVIFTAGSSQHPEASPRTSVSAASCRDAIYSILLADWGAGIRSYAMVTAARTTASADVLANMAAALGRVDVQVLLVYLETAETPPGQAFELNGAGHTTFEDLIAPTEFVNVSTLTIRNRPQGSSHDDFAKLLTQLTACFDLVLVQAPSGADVREAMLKACGGCLLLHTSADASIRDAAHLSQSLSAQGIYVASMLRLQPSVRIEGE